MGPFVYPLHREKSGDGKIIFKWRVMVNTSPEKMLKAPLKVVIW